MEIRGTLKNRLRDPKACTDLLLIEAEDLSGTEIPDGPLAIAIKPWKNRRSKDANAYYWQLVGKMAHVLGRSNNFVHNWMLRDYGTVEEVGGRPVYIPIVDTPEAAEKIEESAEYHLRPTAMVYMQGDGYIYRDYQMIKGSRNYDTEEMSRLIDGAVNEAKAMGINTVTPIELERMKKAYEEHYSNRR